MTSIPASLALAPNLTGSFMGSGGTGPYTYTVLSGGAGGTINSSTGVYTAPAVTGIDTVKVTDSLGAVATSQVTVGNALELLCDIIQTQLGLSSGQVYLWDQKVNIPTDSQLYIAVGVLSCKPFANTNYMDSNGNSIQSVNMSGVVSIDILSRGPAARDRKEEVIMALQSNYAQAQQEANSFYIAKLPTAFTNISQDDGAAIPYRFNISVTVQYAFTKTQAVPYFNTFSTVGVTTEA